MRALATMNPSRTGLTLRLLGPMLEIACIGLLLRGPERNRSTFGMDVEPLLYVGVALGLAMVALGLSLSAARPRTRRRSPDGGDAPPG